MKDNKKLSGKLIYLLVFGLLSCIIGTFCLWLGWDVFLPLAFKDIFVIPRLSFLRIVVLYFALQFISVPIVIYATTTIKNELKK